MANNNQLNTPPNTGPPKPERMSVGADFEVGHEEGIEWMTELGQDHAILLHKLDEMNEKLCALGRRLDSAERIQRELEISHCQFLNRGNLTINNHSQVQDLDRKVQDLDRKVQDLDQKVEEFLQPQRQHQASPLQNPSRSGVENAGNVKVKSDSQNSKPDTRIKAESPEL